MSDEKLAAALTRIADRNKQPPAAPGVAAPAGILLAPGGGQRFPIGARVIDTVSGRTGTVTEYLGALGPEHAIYRIRFADKSVGARANAELEAAPAIGGAGR